jgi:hypothetical protein
MHGKAFNGRRRQNRRNIAGCDATPPAARRLGHNRIGLGLRRGIRFFLVTMLSPSFDAKELFHA